MSEQEEQQTEKKKAGIIKQTFKWLGLGLPTLALIVLIIFQAPWKAITLLAVILLACTALPKRYRKYFWLSVGGVVIALIIWVFLPEETEGWRPYTFDEELAELEAKYAIPDEENAAILYNQLIEDYNEALFEPNFADPNLLDLIRFEPWLSKDSPEAAQWISEHEDTITTLTAVSQIEKCRFPINANIINDKDMMDRFGAMRKWAYLLASAANNDIAEGRTNQAIEKYIAIIQMGKHLRQQPTLIDILVGMGIGVVPRLEMNRFIVEEDNTTEEHLLTIEKALIETELDWSYDCSRFLEYEKLYGKNFVGMLYEVNTEGKARFTRYPTAAIMQQMEGESDANQLLESRMYATYWKKKLTKAKTIWFWFYMPSTPQKASEIIDSAYERYYAMAEPDYDWGKEPAEDMPRIKLNFRFLVEFTASILEGAYRSIHEAYLRASAQQKGSRIIIALRRYKNKNGSWPVSLDEVKSLAPKEIFTDPINGGSFVYKLTDDNFTLYSKGKNDIDEDGQYNWDPNSHERTTEKDDRLIWPTENP